MTSREEKLMQALRRCFTDREWESLIQEKDFREASENVKSLDDAERVANLGNDVLLSISGYGGRPGHRQKRRDL